MKLTTALCQQHVGKMFRNHWKIQGKKKVTDHGALKVLKANGIEFEEALDVIKKKSPITEKLQLRALKPASAFDESAPIYNEISCLTYGDHSVLLEGLAQAKVLTNTVELDTATLGLSNDSIQDQELPLQDKLVERCIKTSLMYDATQEKLPKRKDPLREAWNFPRDYGIIDKRRNYLLVNRLLQLCASFSPQLLGQRSVINSAKFVTPVTLPSEQKILFSVTGDAVVFANTNPNVVLSKPPPDVELPNIYPLAPTISLEKTNFYKFEPSYPLNPVAKLNKIHTVILHYNETQVFNIFRSPATINQILGRSLMQSWIFAMSQAMQASQEEQEKPVTVQTVQTNSQFFHFSILQLNSTSCNSNSAPKNFYWSFPVMNIFEECSYQRGLPVFKGYNPKVFRTLLAFYNNC